MGHANSLTVGRALEKEGLSATILKNLELWASIAATNTGKFIHTCKPFSRSLCRVLMRKMGSRAGDWWKAAEEGYKALPLAWTFLSYKAKALRC